MPSLTLCYVSGLFVEKCVKGQKRERSAEILDLYYMQVICLRNNFRKAFHGEQCSLE